MSGINMLIWQPILDLWNLIMRGIIGLWFGIIQAVAWLLDMLTELFYIFSGMTPVGGSGTTNAEGIDEGIDIVNFFLTRDTFRNAYLWLCGIALGLIIVFTIGKIIKQDYFDRSGPRSKAPIFRNVALSFIAFICIIPLFSFIVEIAGALALLVMKAMGYEGGGVGTIMFNISWADNGVTFQQAGEALGGQPDIKNFGWYPNDTFYRYFWDESEGWTFDTGVENSAIAGTAFFVSKFYWYIFLFSGLLLIVNLGKMMVAMVTRLYKLIALFIVAPSPISQIVLDDGQKFKLWKDRVLQEALKVVGCVMCFMLFIMIAGAVKDLDLMKFAYTSKSASAISLIDNNNLTAELSNISFLYYGGADVPGTFDDAINALGRAMIIIAGVGAIQDMDQTITPLISGGSSSADLGAAGQAVISAGGAAAKGALALGKAGVGLAVGAAEAVVNGSVHGARSIRDRIAGAYNRNADTEGGTDDGAENNRPTGTGGGGTPRLPGGTDTNTDTDDSASVSTATSTGTDDSTSTGTSTGTDDSTSTGTGTGTDDSTSTGTGTGTDDSATEEKSEARQAYDESVEKSDEAQEKLGQAKEGLAAAIENDANKNDILDQIENVENSDKSDEDKQAEISKLEEKYNELDKNPTLNEAKEAYEEASVAANEASMNKAVAYGNLSDDEKAKLATEKASASDDSTGTGTGTTEEKDDTATDDATGTGTGAGIVADEEKDDSTTDAVTDTNTTGHSADGTIDRLGTMNGAVSHRVKQSTKGGRGVKRFIGINLGLASGILAGATKITSGVVKTAGKTGFGIAKILAKTTMQMAGMGKAVNGIEQFSKESKADFKDWKGKHLGKDQNGKYKSAFAATVGATGGALSAAERFVSDGGLTTGAVYGVSRTLEAGVGAIDRHYANDEQQSQDYYAGVMNNNDRRRYTDHSNSVDSSVSAMVTGRGNFDDNVTSAATGAQNLSQQVDNLIADNDHVFGDEATTDMRLVEGRDNEGKPLTLRSEFEDARTDFNKAKEEYETARNGGDAEAIAVAKANLTGAGERLQEKSAALASAAIEKHGEVKKRSAENSVLNRNYKEYNDNVVAANLNLGRMKANVGKGPGKVSEKTVEKVEKRINKRVNSAEAARAGRKKVKLKLGVTAKSTTKKVGKMNAEQAELNKAKKEQEGGNGQGQANAAKPEVEVTTEITPESIATMYSDGVINKSLSNAAINGLSADVDKAGSVDRFAQSINDLDTNTADKKFRLSNEELNRAIQQIDPQKAAASMDKDGIGSFDQYKSNLKSRYESACTQYESAVESAKKLMTEFNSGGGTDVVVLEAAKKAIADAVAQGRVINDIRVEIKDSGK